MKGFRERLQNNEVVVFDGGVGTYLYEKGIYINTCFDELNLTNPDIVSEVHREYVAAGADVIETNTFGANRFKLAPHGLEPKVFEINLKGAQLAKAAAGGEVLVAGSVGPLGVQIEPLGKLSYDEARDAFKAHSSGAFRCLRYAWLYANRSCRSREPFAPFDWGGYLRLQRRLSFTRNLPLSCGHHGGRSDMGGLLP